MSVLPVCAMYVCMHECMYVYHGGQMRASDILELELGMVVNSVLQDSRVCKGILRRL